MRELEVVCNDYIFLQKWRDIKDTIRIASKEENRNNLANAATKIQSQCAFLSEDMKDYYSETDTIFHDNFLSDFYTTYITKVSSTGAQRQLILDKENVNEIIGILENRINEFKDYLNNLQETNIELEQHMRKELKDRKKKYEPTKIENEKGDFSIIEKEIKRKFLRKKSLIKIIETARYIFNEGGIATGSTIRKYICEKYNVKDDAVYGYLDDLVGANILAVEGESNNKVWKLNFGATST